MGQRRCHRNAMDKSSWRRPTARGGLEREKDSRRNTRSSVGPSEGGPSLSSSISLPCFQLNYKILKALAGSHTTAAVINPAPGLQRAGGQEAMLPLTLRPLATLPLKTEGDTLWFLRAFLDFLPFWVALKKNISLENYPALG